jgi:hypothetical protein
LEFRARVAVGAVFRRDELHAKYDSRRRRVAGAVSRTVNVFVCVVVVLSAASVWGVFSVGSVYVFFRGDGVYSIDGRLMYAGGGPAYLEPTYLALGAGSGVSLVTFRNELRVFYPLNFTPTLVGTDCAAVVVVS